MATERQKIESAEADLKIVQQYFNPSILLNIIKCLRNTEDDLEAETKRSHQLTEELIALKTGLHQTYSSIESPVRRQMQEEWHGQNGDYIRRLQRELLVYQKALSLLQERGTNVPENIKQCMKEAEAYYAE